MHDGLHLLGKQLSKLFHISSVLFPCFALCPVLFSSPLAWNAIYKIHRYCLLLHQLNFECWTKHWEIKQISDRIGRESHASSTSSTVKAAIPGFNPKLSVLLMIQYPPPPIYFKILLIYFTNITRILPHKHSLFFLLSTRCWKPS